MKDLAVLLKEIGALPYLFVGSGISKRYINTPTWEEMLKVLAEKIDEPFAKYRLLAAEKVDPDLREESNLFYAEIASQIESEYNAAFFNKKNQYFEKKYNEFECYFEENGFNPFKYEVSVMLRHSVNNFDTEELLNNPELDLLSKIDSKNVAGIITTNYDTFLEDYFFKDYDVLVGNEDILIKDLIGIDELYKIHGCVSDPNTIIINSDDYQKYNSRQTYLAAKLLTIFIEHPIIFIGFGLKDPNIDSLLKSITNALNDKQIDQLANKLILIEWDKNESNYSSGSYNFNGLQIKKYTLNDYSLLFSTLYENRATYSPAVYKRFKNSIYEVVRSNKPSDIIEVSEEVQENVKGGKYIIGFSKNDNLPEVGLSGLTYYQLFEDLLFDNYDITKRLEGVDLLQVLYNAGYQRNYNIPIFKYSSQFGRSLEEHSFAAIKKTMEQRIEDFPAPAISQIHSEKVKLSLETLANDKDLPKRQLFAILTEKLLVTESSTRIDAIVQYAKDNFFEINEKEGPAFRKLLICIDFVLYEKNLSKRG